MTSDRPYRKAMSIDLVVAELNKYAGSQFDPACVEAFLRLLEREGECFIRSELKFDIYEFIEG
jgi:HD-GYP domain-containing protein (c-di-GMP phosphodiesterase class II)